MYCLYLKKCCHCNKLYFGFTTKDIRKYKGSGIHWKDHLKIHKPKVENIYIWYFDNFVKCQLYAKIFSYTYDIINNNGFFNLCIEDCKTNKGYKYTENHRNNLSKSHKGKKLSLIHKKNIGIKIRGKNNGNYNGGCIYKRKDGRKKMWIYVYYNINKKRQKSFYTKQEAYAYKFYINYWKPLLY